MSQQYAQVGNAVPTRLGKVAGDVISRELDEVADEGVPEETAKSFEPRIVYLQSHVRTRQWFKGGETFVWENGDGNEKARYAEPKTIKKMRSV